MGMLYSVLGDHLKGGRLNGNVVFRPGRPPGRPP